uniref:Uncharacterized protein n=1 Tax=Anguilla anguilla TaxID=7936 RepID=A0A0E9TX96_ANGAN
MYTMFSFVLFIYFLTPDTLPAMSRLMH